MVGPLVIRGRHPYSFDWSTTSDRETHKASVSDSQGRGDWLLKKGRLSKERKEAMKRIRSVVGRGPSAAKVLQLPSAREKKTVFSLGRRKKRPD